MLRIHRMAILTAVAVALVAGRVAADETQSGSAAGKAVTDPAAGENQLAARDADAKKRPAGTDAANREELRKLFGQLRSVGQRDLTVSGTANTRRPADSNLVITLHFALH